MHLSPTFISRSLFMYMYVHVCVYFQFQDSPQDSPTQTEKEFLMGMQDSYYDMVPEDTTVLDKSLSSSLSSLCPANKDTPKVGK